MCALRVTQLLLVLLPSRIAQVSVVLEPANGLLYYARYWFVFLFILLPRVQQLSIATYCARCLITQHLCDLRILLPELHLVLELGQPMFIGTYKLWERCDMLQLMLIKLTKCRIIRVTAQLLHERILASCICGIHLHLLRWMSGVQVNLWKLKNRGPGIGAQIRTLRFVRVVIYLMHSCHA